VKRIICLFLSVALLGGCSSVKNGMGVSPLDIINQTNPISREQLAFSSEETFRCIKLATLGGGPSQGFSIRAEDKDILWIGIGGNAIAAVYAVDKSGLMEIYITNAIWIQKEQKKIIGQECAKNTDWQRPEDFWEFMGI
jgi:hypothetical protein